MVCASKILGKWDRDSNISPPLFVSVVFEVVRSLVLERVDDTFYGSTKPKMSIKPVFGAMNSVINWYQPRDTETPAQRQDVVDEVVLVALRGVMAS